MKLASFKQGVLLLAFLLLTASASYAKETGYFYIVAYSIFQKTAYHTSVFTYDVEGTSYSETEYVTDVPLMLKMESQFGAYLKSKAPNAADLTVSVRGAYKTIPKAAEMLNNEKSDWLGQEYTINHASDFQFSGN